MPRRGPAVIEPLEPRAFLTVAGGGFTETAAVVGLRQPTAIAVGPNQNPSVYVAEKLGRIRYFSSGDAAGANPITAATALTIPVDFTGDRGLLGLTVGKYFDNDRSLYAVYVTQGSDPHLRVSRFYASKGNVPASSELVLLDLPAFDGADGKYGAGLTALGGGIHFAFDGTLLIGVGDAGKKENAGDLASPFGKILRIKPDGGVPADNPYGSQDGWKKYVWSYGLHDPATFSVHPENGIVFANDPGLPTGTADAPSAVGQFQEVNRVLPGTDFGWPGGEGAGFGAAPAYQYPTDPSKLTDVTPTAGGEVRGGLFFSPKALSFPAPYGGDYFFADRQAGVIQVMDFTSFKPGAVEVFATDVVNPVDLASNPEGDLYCLSQGIGEADGKLLRYTPNGAPAVVGHPKGGTVSPGATFTLRVTAGGADPFFYQWQRDGVDIPGATESTYVAGPLALADDGATYRVIVSNAVGSAFSRNATVHVVANGGVDDGGTGGGDGGNNGGSGGNGGTGGTPSPFPHSPSTLPQGPFDLLPVVKSSVLGSAVGGSAGRATVRVYNVGADYSPAYATVNLYLSSDRFLDSTDAAVGKAVRAGRIKPGGSKTIKVKFTYPAADDAGLTSAAGAASTRGADATSDTFRILAHVVPATTDKETDELNNTAASDGSVQLVPATVDLRSAIGPLPTAAALVLKPGGKAMLPVTLSNAGNAAILATTLTLAIAVTPGADVSGATGADAAAALATATGVYTVTLKVSLAPGQEKKLKLKFALPADLAAGPYTFVASADTANVVAESDETNNAAVAPTAFTVG